MEEETGEETPLWYKDSRVQLGIVVLIAVLLLIAGLLVQNNQARVQENTTDEQVSEIIEDQNNERSSTQSDSQDFAEDTPAPPSVSTVSDTGGATRGVSSSEQILLLATHNAARGAVSVSPLTWSSSVAVNAQAWADELAERGCVWDHSSTELGENIFYSWNTNPNAKREANEAVDWWVAEEANYTYSSNTCEPGQVCGHYTQVVWADTTQVGCGKSTCDIPGKFEEVWVCQYSPPGNIVGERPY